MVLRSSRMLLSFGGSRGAGVAAPTRGLGRFFTRTKAVLGFEPMFSPHVVHHDQPYDYWAANVFGFYNALLYCAFLLLVLSPFFNTMCYYLERSYMPHRIPLPGVSNVFQELDDPDWRLKREMHVKEIKEGVRPSGYNRYMDIMKNVRVSDPDYKIFIPSEHGEAVGANAADIIRRERATREEAMRARSAAAQ